MSWLTGYSHRKKITVQTANLDAAQTGFKLFVKLDADSDIGAACRADGYDVRFTADDGETELSQYREYFNVSGGEATGHFFVKTDLATSPATEIYVYYGKASATDVSSASAVFSDTFVSRWALDEISGDAIDSCGVNDGAFEGTSFPAQADGPYRKAQQFNGTDNDIDAGNDASLNWASGGATFEGWIRFDTDQTGERALMRQEARCALEVFPTDNKIRCLLATSGTSGWVGDNDESATINAETWYHVAFTYDQALSQLQIYLNGAQLGSAHTVSGTIVSNANKLYLGMNTGDYARIDGRLADLRIAAAPMSAAWIKFEYHNIIEADHELTWGAAEAEAAPVTATPLELELAKATKALAYLLEIELGHRIDTDSWTQCDAPNTAVFWIDHAAEGEPSRVKECDRSTHAIAEYEAADDVADCQATASSWFYDSATGRLYVHTSGGDSPSTSGAYYVMSLFWERLCDGQYEGSKAVYYNGVWYLPYLDESSIPDVSLEVSMFSEGGVKQSFGTIDLINADGYFDQRVADYIYCGKKAVLQVGVPGSALADFVTIWRGWTGNWECTDERLSISTEDERKIAE